MPENNQEMTAGENSSFDYTYSAPEQQEVMAIREKYIPREETKLDRLRRLDESVTKKGMAVSVMTGTASALVLGVGMCMSMVWSGWLFIPGIVVGLLGIAGVCLAYPLYSRTVRTEREKVAPEILRLSDELIK